MGNGPLYACGPLLPDPHPEKVWLLAERADT